MRVVDAQCMQAADAHAIARLGDTELMRRAGAGIAAILRKHARAGSIIAFAGPGNNGGDAFAACAELAADLPCTVYAWPSPRPSPGRLDAERRARDAGVTVRELPHEAEAIARELNDAGWILDGLLGVGGRTDTTRFAPLIDAMNAAAAPICALDLPTGVGATTGDASVPATVRAALTITLGAPKLGLLAAAARTYVGALHFADVGIDERDFALSAPPDMCRYETLTRAEFVAALPARPSEADKRSAGAPFIIAGSEQFPGAAILCARGAARAGAGYVTVASSAGAVAALRTHLVEQVVVAIDDQRVDAAIAALVDVTQHAKAVGLGPGLGLSENAAAITRGFLERTSMPVVIDASGFAHIAKHLDLLRERACVLTPHESEFARLSGKGSIASGTRIARLREFVERTQITTLLKGNATLIYDGTTMHINTTGTSALATAGTGDVLTGIIATLLAQGLTPVDAARVGAYWHGRAGCVAAARRHIGIMAGDLPETLAEAALPFADDSDISTRIF